MELHKGMRQIGKTFIVQAFANENYENVVYINFKDNESERMRGDKRYGVH